MDDEDDEGGEAEELKFKLVDPPTQNVESLGNIDYIFEGGKKKKGDDDEDDSGSDDEFVKDTKKKLAALDSIEDSVELKDDVRSLPGEKKKKKSGSESDDDDDIDDDDSDLDDSDDDSN